MSKTDEEFARFMNLLRWRYDRQVREHDVDPTCIWRFSPSSDEQFLEQMEEVAPIIIERWMRYLTEKGNLTLDQAFFGAGNFARRENNKLSKQRNQLFLNWTLRFQLYERKVHEEYPNLWQLRHDTYSERPELGTPKALEKAWERWCKQHSYSAPDK